LVVLVARVDVHGDEAERDRRALAQHVEHLEERPAVLAPERPTMMRSPSSMRPCSVMARVVFLASRVSRGLL
jgi:hypothetical protein